MNGNDVYKLVLVDCRVDNHQQQKEVTRPERGNIRSECVIHSNCRRKNTTLEYEIRTKWTVPT